MPKTSGDVFLDSPQPSRDPSSGDPAAEGRETGADLEPSHSPYSRSGSVSC